MRGCWSGPDLSVQSVSYGPVTGDAGCSIFGVVTQDVTSW